MCLHIIVSLPNFEFGIFQDMRIIRLACWLTKHLALTPVDITFLSKKRLMQIFHLNLISKNRPSWNWESTRPTLLSSVQVCPTRLDQPLMAARLAFQTQLGQLTKSARPLSQRRPESACFEF